MTQRFHYQKLIRITAWMLRFKHNCLIERYEGPLRTPELKQAEDAWIRLNQQSLDTTRLQTNPSSSKGGVYKTFN
jgi:hypothetical protein